MSLLQSTRKRLYKSTPHLLEQTHERKQWLRKHGKSNRITFSPQMIEKLAKYFNTLDQDGSNTITANELEDPLILFGLCKNRAEVDRIFRLMDIDNSGELEFKEFLEVFRRVATERKGKRQCKRMEIDSTFQDFTSTLLGIQNKLEKGVSFRLGMSIYRRKNMLKAMMGKSLLEKQQGKQIMTKFQQQVSSRPQICDKLKTAREVLYGGLPKLEPRTNLTNHRRVRTMM